jgi:ATP-dependent exoDNAse (exonuclease V) beta subunit
MSSLNIYRASAGSGKTYTLTREYLKLVFEEALNYRSILAVTFTNKATDEMKSRILKEIYILSKGERSPYASELMELNSLDETALQIKAKEILNRLLHDYSRFSVTTIDSFFQKVVRSFTREIGLQMGFNIELDQRKVLNEVVDLLFLDVDEDEQLRSWLSDFAESKIKEGKTWNFKNDILEVGTEVFKEDYMNFDKVLIEKLSDKNFLNAYRKGLKQIKDEFENTLKEIGTKAVRLIENQGLTITDFSFGKSGFVNYFYKLQAGDMVEPGTRVLAAIDNPDKWTTAKASPDLKAAVSSVYSAGLGALLKNAVEFFNNECHLYFSTDKTLKYIYTLGILTDISKKIKSFTEDENLFLLSEASRLLRSIIGTNDTPFVYEKIGNVYKHFMIDEFQDTSSMQWENFRPLVGNSLAEDNRSLVVGDVKQSIYRWRNGDWKLLAEQLDVDFKDQGINGLTLDMNWRSSKNVINFNNALYALASQALQNDYNNDIPKGLEDKLSVEKTRILNAYADVYQGYPGEEDKCPGYVKAHMIEVEKGEKWIDHVLELLPTQIEEIQAKGYKAGDMAILVRNGREGAMIANKLMTYRNSESAIEGVNYNVISNESLYLKNSSVISFLSHLLRYFIYPEDKINLAYLLQEYGLYLREANPENFDDIFAQSEDSEDIFKGLFPAAFIENISLLKRQALFDLVEQLIDIFELNKRTTDFPYLEAYQDLVLGFSRSDAPDLNSFVDYWEERKDKEVISVSDHQDAIRILTIHKSKGLEFKAVLLPFCDWDLDDVKHTKILWCQPELEGFNNIDVLPIRYGSDLKQTIYYKEYFAEKLQAYIDNLNLLYVATTRAEEILITYSPLPTNDKFSKVSHLLYYIFENAAKYSSDFGGKEIINMNTYWDDENKCFELGALTVKKSEDTEHEVEQLMTEYPAAMLDNRLKLHSHAADYFDFSEAASIDSFAPVNRGNILHSLFQDIEYYDDIKKAIAKKKHEGKLDELQADEVREMVEDLFKNPQIAFWFSKDWRVINERDVLLGDENILRPDRVIVKDDQAIVIDYKFGKKKEKDHIRQVGAYKKLLEKMNFKQVSAFILYGKLDEIVEV